MIIKYAISIEDIKSKYHNLKDPSFSYDEFCNAIDRLNEVDPYQGSTNQFTAQYIMRFIKGEALDALISELSSKSVKTKQDKLDIFKSQFSPKYNLHKHEFDNLVEKIYRELPDNCKQYTLFAVKAVAEGNQLHDVIPTISAFEKSKDKLSKQNINQYTYDELHDEINKIPDSHNPKSFDQISIPEIYENANIAVYRLDNKFQAIKAGEEIPWKECEKYFNINSRWCITLTNHNYFSNYSMRNVVFYLVDQKNKDWTDPFKRVVIHYERDMNNDVIREVLTSLENIEYPASKHPYWNEIENIIKEDVAKQPEAVISKINNGTASQKEFNAYLLTLEEVPPAVLEEHGNISLQELNNLAESNPLYFADESVKNLFKNRKDEISKEIINKREEIINKIEEANNDPKICLRDSELLIYLKDNEKNRKICLETVKRDGKALYNIPERLRTEQVCIEAVKQNGYALYHVPRHLRTEQICLEAVKQYGLVLQYVPEHLRTEELCLIAVKENGNALEYVPEHLRKEQLCLEAVKQRGNALCFVPEHLRTEELCLIAVKENGYALYHVPKHLKPIIKNKLNKKANVTDMIWKMSCIFEKISVK